MHSSFKVVHVDSGSSETRELRAPLLQRCQCYQLVDELPSLIGAAFPSNPAGVSSLSVVLNNP